MSDEAKMLGNCSLCGDPMEGHGYWNACQTPERQVARLTADLAGALARESDMRGALERLQATVNHIRSKITPEVLEKIHSLDRLGLDFALVATMRALGNDGTNSDIPTDPRDAVVEAAKMLIRDGLRGTFDSNGRPVLAVIEKADKSDAHWKLCDALRSLGAT